MDDSPMDSSPIVSPDPLPSHDPLPPPGDVGKDNAPYEIVDPGASSQADFPLLHPKESDLPPIEPPPGETYKQAVERILAYIESLPAKIDRAAVPGIVAQQGYPRVHQWHIMLRGTIIRLLGIAAPKSPPPASVAVAVPAPPPVSGPPDDVMLADYEAALLQRFRENGDLAAGEKWREIVEARRKSEGAEPEVVAEAIKAVRALIEEQARGYCDACRARYKQERLAEVDALERMSK